MIITIDLWGTLIKPNPEFSVKKIELAKKHFNVKEDKLKDGFKKTKSQLDSIIELTGWQPDSSLVYELLIRHFGFPYNHFDLTNFIREYQNLAIEYNPTVYSEETFEYLDKLSKLGYLYISSNTMMLNGKTLRTILDKLNLSKYFKRFLFSDELGYSKPNSIMFAVSDYHIGDNLYTDYIGAQNIGSVPFIINSNDKTIKDAYNFLIDKK